jgi:hypothetical protein
MSKYTNALIHEARRVRTNIRHQIAQLQTEEKEVTRLIDRLATGGPDQPARNIRRPRRNGDELTKTERQSLECLVRTGERLTLAGIYEVGRASGSFEDLKGSTSLYTACQSLVRRGFAEYTGERPAQYWATENGVKKHQITIQVGSGEVPAND